MTTTTEVRLLTAGELDPDGGFEFKLPTDGDDGWRYVTDVDCGGCCCDTEALLVLVDGTEVAVDRSASVQVRAAREG